jgi:hypothetical protein
MQSVRVLHPLSRSRYGYLTGVGRYGAAVPRPVPPAAWRPPSGFGAVPPPPVLGPPVCANPLPPGRYAITLSDSPKGSVRAFGIWADQNDKAVKVESKQELAAGDTLGLVAIFSVSAPVMWNPTVWGCPNVAGATIKTPQDAQPALKPPTSSNPLCALMPSFCGGAGGGIPTWVYLTVGAVLIVALAPTMFEVSKVVAIREEHKA